MGAWISDRPDSLDCGYDDDNGDHSDDDYL